MWDISDICPVRRVRGGTSEFFSSVHTRCRRKVSSAHAFFSHTHAHSHTHLLFFPSPHLLAKFSLRPHLPSSVFPTTSFSSSRPHFRFFSSSIPLSSLPPSPSPSVRSIPPYLYRHRPLFLLHTPITPKSQIFHNLFSSSPDLTVRT